jgi:hypothetical protein
VALEKLPLGLQEEGKMKNGTTGSHSYRDSNHDSEKFLDSKPRLNRI